MYDVKGNSNTVYLDFPMFRKITKNGELTTFDDSDALAQSIKIWLSSDKGEKIRNLSGGVLAPYLGKLMSYDTAKEMENQIRKSIQEEFNPPIQVVYLKVTPNYDKEQWIIDLAGYNKELSVGVNTSMVIMNI